MRWTLLAVCVAALASCGETADLSLAVETLKSREDMVTQREAASVVRNRELLDRERVLVTAELKLEEMRAGLEKQKEELQAEIDKAKSLRESLLLKEKRGPVPRVGAQRVIVIDPKTGEVLLEKNADLRGAVASTQKLLTALLIVENGGLDLPLTVTKEDCDCAPVRFGLKVGDQYSRRQLLTALLVKSSNDIAQALARDHAGSLEAFADRMNERARSLGMKNSRFINPNGLPADGQYSTARDMAAVAIAVDSLPDIRAMVKTKTYGFKKMDGSLVLLSNTNRVLHNNPECDGMKTGFTVAAGHCLISSGERAGKRRIVVMLNSTNSEVWRDSQALLDWALRG